MPSVLPAKFPTCYGHLYDSEDETNCQICLLQDDCLKAMSAPKIAPGIPFKMPETRDKRLRILAECKKYNLSTKYYSRNLQREYEITEENMHEFKSIDFLLCSDSAVRAFLEAPLELDGDYEDEDNGDEET